MVASSIRPNSSFLCLVLSNCNLNAQSLTALLPTLAQLPNFRLLDLSQNLHLFSSQPDALSILRRYLPRLPVLKKLMLDGTSMDADQAIALCEIIPDVRQLSHLSLLRNPVYAVERPGSPSPSSESEAREENAALFTALVAMAKCSRTLVRIDVDKPPKGDEFVLRTLAKRMLSYLLRNMEKGACDDWMADTVADTAHADDVDDEDDQADGDVDDEDYVIGGTGVVKALGVCLTNTPNRNFTSSPLDPTQLETAKAHEMSKALLSRARSIKARVEGALNKNTTHDEMGRRRLLFLDDTLKKVIGKFEQEYPECRLPPCPPAPSLTSPIESADIEVLEYDDALDLDPDSDSIEERDAYGPTIKPSLSRRGSDISLASKKKVNEEAQMLKLGKLLIQGEEAGCISGEEGDVVVEDVVHCPEVGQRELEAGVDGVADCARRKLEAEQERRRIEEERIKFNVNGMNGVNGGGVTWTQGYLEPVVESKKAEPVEKVVNKTNGVERQPMGPVGEMKE
jgi:hypothetical protein